MSHSLKKMMTVTVTMRKRLGPIPDPWNISVKANVPNRLPNFKRGRLQRELGKNQHQLRGKCIKVIFPVTRQILQDKIITRALKTAEICCAFNFVDGECTIYDLHVLHRVTERKLLRNLGMTAKIISNFLAVTL
jgi:hypothetical protein